jgi:hypothetical protein
MHITASQNIISIDNDLTKKFKDHNKIDKNKKEKYKTLILLDNPNNTSGTIFNRNNSNKYIIPQEKENKSCNKYTYHEQNLISDNNNNEKKKNFKIHLSRKNKIKIMNTNININLNNKFINRKFTLNLKDIVNNKIKKEKTNRANNFISKDKKSKASMKRFKSLNNNNYKINYNNLNKENQTHNANKQKNEKVKYLIEKKPEVNGSKKNIGVKKNILNHNNLELINSIFPQLKHNKNIVISKK